MILRQLIVDARGCAGPLDDPDALMAAMRHAAAVVGAREHGGSTARFVPHGVTAIVILAESHVLVSTWPEHGLALVDVLLCHPGMAPEAVWEDLATVLRPTTADVQSIIRRVGG